MKISKIAIAVLFTAGFLTTSATASMATSCAGGYTAVEGVFPDPMYTCEPIESVEGEVVEPVEGDVDVKPIDSCWTTEDGLDVCAKGLEMPISTFRAEPGTEPESKPIDSCWTTEDGVQACARTLTEPMPVSAEETPVDSVVCDPTGLVDSEGNQPEACLYDITLAGEEVDAAILEKGEVDEPLMYQSGVATAASTPDQTASNTLATFGVLVGVLGAFGIALSRERASE